MKPKEFYIPVDVFEDGCWIVWSINKESAEEWFKDKFPNYDAENFDDFSDGHTDALAVHSTPKVIFISDWETTSEKISTLAHEFIHVANYIILDKQIKEEKGCDEVLCYLVGFLMRKALEEFKRIGEENPGDEQAVGG